MTLEAFNVLDNGGYMRRCVRCQRWKAKFVANPKEHGSMGMVCWHCTQQQHTETKRGETRPRPEAGPTVRIGRPHTGGVFRRGSVWWIRYTPTTGAKEIRTSSGSKDRTDAERLLGMRLCENTQAGCAETVRKGAEPSHNLPQNGLDRRSRGL
jgi:hypothetical protein